MKPVFPILLFMAVAASSFGQCIDISQSPWSINTVPTNVIYYDVANGGITRIGDKTTHARIANATNVTTAVTVNQTATIVPSASSSGTVNVPVGQQQTISAIYAAPNATITTGQSWAIGWSNIATFTGVSPTSVNSSAGFWAADVLISYSATGASITAYYGSANSQVIYGNGTTTTLQAGDSISISLVPQTGGSTSLQVIVYRPSAKLLLGAYNIPNALPISAGANGTKALYPTVSVLNGAANVGCIKLSTQVFSSPAPNVGTAGTGVTSPWQVNAANATYTMVYDGTVTRLAPKSNSSTIVTSSSLGGPTISDVAAVYQNATNLSVGDSSVVSTTFLAPNSGSNNQRWMLGWAFTQSFAGANPNSIATTIANAPARWAANLYVQGNVLYYYSPGASIYTGLTAGDQITGQLVPNGSGGADLVAIIYRPSVNAIAFATHIPNIINPTLAALPLYAAVTIENGEVNLSSISSAASSFSVLPVTLVSFSGSLQNGIAQLTWQTGLEANFSHFEIEKSNDAQTYTVVGSAVAKGNNSSYKAQLPQTKPRAYYRLRMVDKDGHTTFSQVVTLSQLANATSLKIYPNPAINHITVEGDKATIATIILYNAMGQRMGATRITRTNDTQATVNLQGLPPGLYTVKTKTATHTFQKQ